MIHWLITMLAPAGIRYPSSSKSLIAVRATLQAGGYKRIVSLMTLSMKSSEGRSET